MKERLSSRADDFRQMAANGMTIAEDIEADVQRLAEKMRRIHGGEYRILIDHEPGEGFIVIRIRGRR
jgi:hypothetical protein